MKKNTLLSMIFMALLFGQCKKDKKTEENPDENNGGSSSTKYALVIENGAQSVEVGQSMNYKAYLVSTNGTTVAPASLTWSSNIGGMSSAVFSLGSATVGLITANASFEGKNYTASVPISVQPVKDTRLFAVVPSAIVVSTGFDPIPLNTVYLGTGGSSYSFSSDNSNVATVSSSGVVTFKSAGTANIKVNATINGQASEVIVPILVVGVPEVPLPVTKITLSPALGQMFRGETLQFNAKAFDSSGKDVTSSVNFNYQVMPKAEDDGDPTIPVTVNASGLVTANSLGSAYLQVFANGMMAQSEVIVNPDTVVMVNPFYAELGGFNPITMQPNPDSQVFTATTYKVDRQAYKSGQSNFLNTISNPSNLKWELPLTGNSQIDEPFKVVTLSNASNNSVTATKIQGKAGSTFIIANAGTTGGAGVVMVMP